MADFHFLQPLGGLLLPVLLALSYWCLKGRNTRQHWSEVCDPELLPLLVKDGHSRSRPMVPALAIMVSLLLTIAVAQPVWEKQPRPAFKQGGAVVIAWDLSASMNATDLKPSRLARSRFKIEDLLGKLADSQVALLVYAGDAFVVTPLTEDVDTIHAQLPAMLPDIMPAQGSRADKALKLAGDMLKQAGIQGGNILLVSDEVSPAQVAAEASRLRQQGRQLSILALGTEEGAPIPVSTGQIKDKQGRVVLARMQMHLMQEAAALGGGNAVKLVNDDSDLNRLIAGFSQDKRTTAAPGAEVDHWVAQGPWFVLLALLLLLPVFRRGILNLLLPALFIGVLIPAPDAEAGLWQDLWQSPDQQGAQLYKQGDKAAAAEQFDNPRWKQVSQYDDGQYEAALESLPIPETAADWYNRANTLTRNGQLDDAIAAYEKALELQPAHEAAAHNKKLLEDLKQQQEEQEQPQKQDQNQQGKEGDQQHSEDAQDGQQQQNSQQNNKNQRQKDQQNSDKKNADQNQGNTQEQSSSDAGQSGSNQEKTQDKPSQQSDEPGQMTAGEQEKQQAKEEARQAADYLKQQLNQRKPEKQEQTEAASSVGQSGQPTPVDEAEQARQQLLNRIVDDPAGLWRRKFIYQYRQQAEQPSAEEKLW